MFATFVIQSTVIIQEMAEPFRYPGHRRLEFFNNTTLLLWCHCMFIFSLFVPDAMRRFEAGYWFLTLLGINALVNIVYQYVDMPYQILKYPKKWFKQAKQKYNKRFGQK